MVGLYKAKTVKGCLSSAPKLCYLGAEDGSEGGSGAGARRTAIQRWGLWVLGPRFDSMVLDFFFVWGGAKS